MTDTGTGSEFDELITLEEAADRLGYSLGALRKAAQRGRIGRKVGRYYVTTAGDVARYVAEVEQWRARHA